MATPLSVPPRRLKTLVRSSGDLADPLKRSLSTAILRRSPVPVQPAHSGRPSYGPDGNPGPPGSVLASTSPGAASAFRLPLWPALALPHFRTPHEAPLTGQDASRISEVLGTGIRNAKI